MICKKYDISQFSVIGFTPKALTRLQFLTGENTCKNKSKNKTKQKLR